MPDAVTHWNDVLLNIVRAGGGPPGPISRGGAMMHGAIYDAVNSIVPTHAPYLISVPTTTDASLEAAIAYAAHDTLAAAFPSTTIDLAGALAGALAGLTPPASVSAGKAIGRACAAAMIRERDGDGADDATPYVNTSQPGDWVPTGSGPAASPHWPKVKPFGMVSGSQFRPPRPGGYLSKTEMLRSAEYTAQYNEVKRLGAATGSARTPEQTEIAMFWANDLDGSYKPPGHLFAITKVVAEQKMLDVVENARLFALVALAMADAGICAWDAKYSTDLDLWRPETAIHEAHRTGNPDIGEDDTWRPLSTNRAGEHFSPNFPAYVSGHATFGAAHASIMRLFFGTDNVTFSVTSEDPILDSNVPRTFNSFTEAARENARSRVYLGVHFQWDGDHGYHAGTALAEYIFGRCLTPLAVRENHRTANGQIAQPVAS